MKPYGLPRTHGQDDVAGIREFGRNTSTGGKCYQKPEQKARSRKTYKVRERRKSKNEIYSEVESVMNDSQADRGCESSVNEN